MVSKRVELCSDLRLPAISSPPQGIIRGRSVHDGYVRGWGLQFDGLADRVRADGHFAECSRLAAGRAVLHELSRINLYLIIREYLPRLKPGSIVEFGSYKGGTALFMAAVAQDFLPNTRVYALDTFQGMPEGDPAIDMHGAGQFSDVDLSELRDYAREAGLNNIQFVEGRFEHSFVPNEDAIGPIALSHIDCDIRSAVAYSYEMSRSRMVPGGYIIFDDSLTASCLGATEVVEEIVIQRDKLFSEQVFPHHVFRARF
jgi:predicted O-methyltransferase YrrM